MSNTPLTLNAGRQYPLSLTQAFAFEHVSEAATAVKIASLPRGAVITDGKLVVDTAFSAGTLSFGFEGAPAAHGAIDASSTGVRNLTLTGASTDKPALIVTPSAAMSAGSATLYLTYVIDGRANEAQP